MRKRNGLKSFRKINKNQLINQTNEKDCLVEIEFSVNSREYLVRRGIKPNVFDIEVNGTQLHKEADDRANQKILEENKKLTSILEKNKITLIEGYEKEELHENISNLIFNKTNGKNHD